MYYTYLLERKGVSQGDLGKRWYIGVHGCRVGEQPETDGYWGSGASLPKGRGADTFTKHITATFPTVEAANWYEGHLLRYYNVAHNPMFYNNTQATRSRGMVSRETREKQRNAMLGKKRKPITDAHREKLLLGAQRRRECPPVVNREAYARAKMKGLSEFLCLRLGSRQAV